MTNRIDFRRHMLLGGVASLALVAAPALAQQGSGPTTGVPVEEAAPDALPENDDEIVITGFRAALEGAIATKREADQIVESVSAEDIGKLPDNSIAEAIARLPGLTAQRLDGRAQVISIRGLAPDFSTTLLNGREQVTTGDNRGVEFDQYPSEVMSAVVVYKTPQAGLVGQGLSGTVDLRTVRPLDFGRQAIALNLRGENLSLGKLNAGSEDMGYRGSVTYIDQFANDTLGIALSLTHLNSPTQIERFNSWGYTGAAGGELAQGGVKPYVTSTELKRTGVSATVQYEPSETLTTTLDLYYSKFKDEQILRGVELPLLWGGATLAPGYTAEDGIVTSGTFSNVKAIVRNDANLRDADLYSVGWNTTADLGGWRVTGDISASGVKRDDTVLETNAGTGRAGQGDTDTLAFIQDGSGIVHFDPTLDYADPTTIFLTSPQGWGAIPGGQDGFINNPHVKDDLIALRGSVEHDLEGLFSEFEVGINYTTREKSLELDRYYLVLAANAADPEHDVSVPIPQDLLLRPTELNFLGIPGMVSYDPFALVDSGIYNLVPPEDANLYAFGWEAQEDVLTAWAKLDIDQDFGWGYLTGNVGAQIVQTDQSSDGLAASGDPAVVSPVSDGRKYTDVLPTLNLSMRLPSEFVVRLGIAREMARPRMDEMRASINFSYDASRAGNTDINFSPWGGSGGNPRLKPWMADAVDLSVEKYFGRDAYVALTGFYKDLKTYIYNQNLVYDFSGFPVPSGSEPVLREGIVSLPQNGEGGEIYGFEASGALPFGGLIGFLDGFGVTGSLSYTESNIQPNPADPAMPLPGLSKYVANATAFYEMAGFSARASLRHRSKFRGEVVGIGTERLIRYAKAETVLDAQIGYEFQSGALEGLGLLLQGQNLTDEPFVTYEAGDERRVIDHQSYGRRYLFGVSYKF